MECEIFPQHLGGVFLPTINFRICVSRHPRKAHIPFPRQKCKTPAQPLQNHHCNKGSLAPIALVGNARNTQLSRARATELSQDETIACVSGFLLNMVDKSIQLVTPCPVSERWPLGYIVYERAEFEDEIDLERTIERMIAIYMHRDVPADRPLRFRSDLKYSSEPDGFLLASPHANLAFRDNPLLEVLGNVISQGTMCLSNITNYFQEEFSVEQDISRGWIKLLFENGVLDEEPLSVEAAPPMTIESCSARVRFVAARLCRKLNRLSG